MWTYQHKTASLHLLNKSFTENFIFCVVNIIGFTTESYKFSWLQLDPNPEPLSL